MRWIQPKLKQTNGLSSSSSSPSPSPSPSFSYVPYQKESASLSSSSLSGSNRSPVVIFIIIILAVIFFLCGILHLLIRFFMKKRSSSSANTQSNSYPEISGSHTYQRQLQQLFTLHDSGLDQAFIDALPVFQYKEIMGLKEPFDCPVCLCEFSQQDKLRLLPLCSHAFHIDCIDTWLLSNSTCPLCRGTLFAPGFSYENPVFYFDDTIDEDGFSGSIRAGVSCSKNPAENDGIASEKTIFPVRLGKFRNTNGSKEDSEVGETSNSTLDARRCYSMGSFQYVVADLDLQVAFCPNKDGGMANCGNKGIVKARVGHNGNSSFNGEDADMKRINIRSKGESFSVSKIWLWSKKGKIPISSDAHMVNSSVDESLPWSYRNHAT